MACQLHSLAPNTGHEERRRGMVGSIEALNKGGGRYPRWKHMGNFAPFQNNYRDESSGAKFKVDISLKMQLWDGWFKIHQSQESRISWARQEERLGARSRRTTVRETGRRHSRAEDHQAQSGAAMISVNTRCQLPLRPSRPLTMLVAVFCPARWRRLHLSVSSSSADS